MPDDNKVLLGFVITTGHELSLAGNDSDVSLLIIFDSSVRLSRAIVIVYCRIRERLFNVAERHAIMPRRRVARIVCYQDCRGSTLLTHYRPPNTA